MATYNGLARIIPFRRKKTLTEKIAVAILVMNILEFIGFFWALHLHLH